jgi:hypothetical protein
MVVFDPVTRNGAAITSALMQIWERFGEPDDFSNKTGQLLLQEIISVWRYFFKAEYEATMVENKRLISIEKSASQMKMGYMPISYPPTLFNLIKAMFPKVNLSSRKTQKIIQQLAPELKTTKLRI